MLMVSMAPGGQGQGGDRLARAVRRLWIALSGGLFVTAPVHTAPSEGDQKAATNASESQAANSVPLPDNAGEDPLEQTVYGAPLERLIPPPAYGPPAR
jgi:hypothetical protein